MENKEMKIILWATQGLISSMEDNGVKPNYTEEEHTKMLKISYETYNHLAFDDGALMVDNQTLLRELLDEVLGGK